MLRSPRNRILSLIGIAILSTLSCGTEEKAISFDSRIKLEVSNAFNEWLFLEKLSVFEEAGGKIDSIFIKERVEPVQFLIKGTEEGLYKIYSRDHRLDIVLINTKEPIELKADYFDNGRYEFTQSTANISLQQFLSAVRTKAENIRRLSMDSSSLPEAENQLQFLQLDYRNYVDTVASPAAALYVYNAVDFGKQRDSLKLFVGRLQRRFPAHRGIQLLVEDVSNFLSIYEQELEIGDTIPPLTVYNTSGVPTPVKPISKYTLIEFWASWDGPSRKQLEYDKKALEGFRNKGFSILSVSLDPEKREWEKFLQSGSYRWEQLLDGNAWRGPSVKAYKFDSIPFNYLVDSSGKIIDKALYGDRLFQKLSALQP